MFRKHAEQALSTEDLIAHCAAWLKKKMLRGTLVMMHKRTKYV